MTDLKEDLASLRIDRSRKSRRRRPWFILMLAVILVVIAGGFLLKRDRAPRAVQTIQPTVTVGGPPAGTPILNAAGYLVPRRKAVVSSKIQGRLLELRVEEGARVKSGDVIARLEDNDFRAQLARTAAAVVRSQADLSESRRQLAVAQRLLDEGVGSQDTRDAAESRVRLGEATLAQSRAETDVSRAQLENTVIRAPFTGTVLRKMAEVGESVAPIPPGVNISSASGAIVVLADLDTLESEVDVAEANVAVLTPENPAEVTVEAFPDKVYKAALRQVIPTADRTKATVLVKVTLLDKDPNLKPEMSAKVAFLSVARVQDPNAPAPQSEITVPSTAVVVRDGADLVFVVEAGKAVARPVKLGDRRGANIIVNTGLVGTESLLSAPPDDLKSGESVVSGAP